MTNQVEQLIRNAIPWAVARIFESSDDRYSESALDAVRAWKFYPGTRAGTPAKFIWIAPVRFAGWWRLRNRFEHSIPVLMHKMQSQRGLKHRANLNPGSCPEEIGVHLR